MKKIQIEVKPYYTFCKCAITQKPFNPFKETAHLVSMIVGMVQDGEQLRPHQRLVILSEEGFRQAVADGILQDTEQTPLAPQDIPSNS